MTASRLRRFARELVGLYWDPNEVPALAWFLLSSLVPLALGVTALAAVALGDHAEAQALSVRISRVLPKDALRKTCDGITGKHGWQARLGSADLVRARA